MALSVQIKSVKSAVSFEYLYEFCLNVCGPPIIINNSGVRCPFNYNLMAHQLKFLQFYYSSWPWTLQRLSGHARPLQSLLNHWEQSLRNTWMVTIDTDKESSFQETELKRHDGMVPYSMLKDLPVYGILLSLLLVERRNAPLLQNCNFTGPCF